VYYSLIGVDAGLLRRGVVTTEDLYEWGELGSFVFVVDEQARGSIDYEHVCEGEVTACLSSVSRDYKALGSSMYLTDRDVVIRGWNVVNINHACLNVGCGASVFKGCVNIDKRVLRGVDLVVDLEGGYLPFPDMFFKVVYAFDVLEHISWRALPKLLAEVKRVLNCGGRFIIRVPDIERIAMMVLNRDYPRIVHPDVGEFNEYMLISYFIYGGQEYPEDTHKSGFTMTALRELINTTGFKVVEVRDAHTEHPNIFAVAMRACY
jgi:SAM-dependent methyltransferase